MKQSLFLLSFLALAACQPATESGQLHGYAEGDFIALAPDAPGRITVTLALEGDRVSAGSALAEFDAVAQSAAVSAAEARLEAANARFDDAAAGARAPEIGAARDQLEQARAAQVEASDTLERTRELFSNGHVSQARLDQAQAAADAAIARTAEMRQRLALVQLPARENQLRALQAEIEAVQAELDQARHALSLRTLSAPADGRIHRQIRFAGEQAGPSAAVYEFLPDGNLHAVLFLPETEIGRFQPGMGLSVQCDGCPAGLTARISTIADEAEFTPPIIYSESERSRLVFRAEALFDGPAPAPGTPLRFEVRP